MKHSKNVAPLHDNQFIDRIDHDNTLVEFHFNLRLRHVHLGSHLSLFLLNCDSQNPICILVLQRNFLL